MDLEIDKAREWLVHNARKCAQAKANRTYCEEYRKSLKAILFNQETGSVADRENKAYAHERYLKHLEDLKTAVFEDEHLKALREAASIKIELYRTEQATLRSARV